MTDKEYRPTLAQLRAFATVAEQGHFGTAARHLGISQPSLSQALRSLETGLGVRLIERSTRRVIVTAVGRQLFPYARRTVEAADAFADVARGAGGGTAGPLVLGMIPTVAPFILPSFLQALPEAMPDLEPKIVEEKTDSLTAALGRGNLDAAVVASPVDRAGVTTLELYTEEFVIVLPVGHPMAGRDDVTVDELDGLDLLLLDDGHCLRDQVLDLCRAASVSVDPAQTVTRAAGLSTVVQCVVGGLGATLVPLSAVATECARPGVALARFAGGADEAGRRVSLCFRASSTRVEAFTAVAGVLRGAYRTAAGNGLRLLGGRAEQVSPGRPSAH